MAWLRRLLSPKLRAALADALLVGLIVAAGLSGTHIVHRALVANDEAQQRERLGAIGQDVVSAFDLQLVRTMEAVRVAALLLATDPDLDRDRFNQFGRDLMDDTSMLALLEWQPVVPAAQLASFEARARADGLPAYRVVEPDGAGFKPVLARPEYVPVLYSWPEAEGAVGLDMSFSAVRMRSKLLARDLGAAIASETFPIIRTIRPETQVNGFAISAPAYRHPMPVDRESRRQQLMAYVAGVVEVPTVMREASRRADANGLDMFVYDLETPDHRLIFAPQGAGRDAPAPPPAGPRADPSDMALTIDVATRPWQIVLHPRPSSADSAAIAFATWTRRAGWLTTLLVALAVARSLVIRRRLEVTEIALAADRQTLTDVLDGTAAGTWEWNASTGVITVNERWAQMLGWTRQELAPVTLRRLAMFCHADDVRPAQERLIAHLKCDSPSYDVEFRMRHKEGRWVWVQCRGRVFERDATGRALRMAGTQMDVTDKKLSEEQAALRTRELEFANRRLKDLAITDALTGAFNRRHFNDVCRNSLTQAVRGGSIALCMLDIDHFKDYNDHFGHLAGDAVLHDVAAALRQCLQRSTDALFRLGGEEFGVLFAATTAEAAEAFVDELCEAVRALRRAHPHSAHGIVTASFGLAWWEQPHAALTPEQMYAEADRALYEAKQRGRNQVVSHRVR